MLKGPMAGNKANTIMISAESEDNPKGPIIIRDNHFINAMGRGTSFVHNFDPADRAADICYRPNSDKRGFGRSSRRRKIRPCVSSPRIIKSYVAGCPRPTRGQS
jgi:hypothetical protein